MTSPVPWSSGLPWNDASFSERMLAEHLSQDHGAASRRFIDIDVHVTWLHGHVLGGATSRILDLGCGPGLYTSRLSALGHTCVGIDFAPAAIAHAVAEAERTGLACTYHLADVRTAEIDSGFDLVTFLFGDLDTIAPEPAADLLARVGDALRPGGKLVLEVHTRQAVESVGVAEPSRASVESGLFGEGPHTVEETSWWDPSSGIAMRRIRIAADSAPDEEHVITTQARGRDGYAAWLASAGFLPPIEHAGFGDAIDPGFVVLVAEKA